MIKGYDLFWFFEERSESSNLVLCKIEGLKGGESGAKRPCTLESPVVEDFLFYQERGQVGASEKPRMEGSREDNGSSHGMQEFQSYQEQLVIQREQQAQHYNNIDNNKNQDGLMFPAEATNPSILPWPHPSQFSTSCQIARQENFFSSLPPLPPPPPPPLPPPPPSSLPHLPFYGDLYARRASAALQFAYGGGNGMGPSTDTLGLAGLYMGSEALVRGAALPSSSLFGGLQTEVGRMSQQEILDAKALAASKSHSEAERRRRERINAHLAKLRSMLPSTTKTDKASLLAEVIQHVKELKRQTSEIAEESPLPSEADELTVDAVSDEDGRLVVRASLCCDDRSELLPDLIKALKALRLRALKAEITTLGGRVKNVLVVTGEDGAASEQQHSISAIQDALKAVMERAGSDEPSSSTGIKRQRTTNLSSILQHNTSI